MSGVGVGGYFIFFLVEIGNAICWKNLFDFDERSHVWNVRSFNEFRTTIDLWPLPE